MRVAGPMLLSASLALTVLLAADLAQAESEELRAPASSADATIQEAHVTYVTQSIVYIDAGMRDGLAEGDLVEVIREGKIVSRLEVIEVSSHKAACRREEGVAIDAGDAVRFAGHATAVPDSEQASARKGKADSQGDAPWDLAGRLHDLGLSGRVGLRYLMVYEPDSDFGYNQPGLDLRLRGKEIAGSHFDTDVDVRAYRSYRDSDGDSSTSALTRVYRANVAWGPETVPMRMVLGRQFSPSLANLSLFDGALVEYNAPRWTVGALGGTQPDGDDYGLSTDVHEYGTWGEVHSEVGAERRWAGTLGLIGSYDGSELNREFVYLQGRYDEKRGSLYVAQEVDINRSWKKDDGESTLSATSTHAHGRVKLTEALTLSAGIDNRRDVRLYRDYVSPETDFDDDYRSGYWARTDARFGWARAGFDVRLSRGGEGGDANAYSLHLGAVGVTPLRLDLRTRTTRYDGDDADGWLQSFTTRAPIGQRVGVALHGGLRDETSNLSNGLDSQVGWYGTDLDVLLGEHWLFLLSVERTEGDGVGNYQLYSALSYRF